MQSMLIICMKIVIQHKNGSSLLCLEREGCISIGAVMLVERQCKYSGTKAIMGLYVMMNLRSRYSKDCG